MDNSLEQMQRWFPAETKCLHQKTKDGEYVFEIGITLAGAISGGAYAAGVFDFLFESLDAWYLEKHTAKTEGRNNVPKHDVCIKVLTGASAGSINGLIMALMARRKFTHGKHSPFYKVWVNDIDITKLTSLDDLKNGNPQSLLNSKVLDCIAKNLQSDVAVGKKYPILDNYQTIRQWMGDSMEMSFTSTNLDGTAFKVNFRGMEDESGASDNPEDGMDPHWVYQHKELINFAVPTTAHVANEKYPPHYFQLSEQVKQPDWAAFINAGLASSAFPIALKSREITRPKEHYQYMFVSIHKGQYFTASPSFNQNITSDITYTSVDGGAMNNEPFAYAHQRLAGISGTNPREGQCAHRAILMIDPFPERPEEKAANEESMLNPIITNYFKLLTAWKNQARFKEKDLASAQNRNIYSRFIIAPRRSGKKHYAKAVNLASGSLGAFGGFFHKAFRHHDYELGRRNAQKFLRDEFMLPQNNPLMEYGYEGMDTELYRGQSGRTDRKNHLQIIPLINEQVRRKMPRPHWPAKAFDNKALNEKTKLVYQRVYKVTDAVISNMNISLMKKLFLKAALRSFSCKIKEEIHSSLQEMQKTINKS